MPTSKKLAKLPSNHREVHRPFSAWIVKPWPLGPPPEPRLIPITLESGTAEVEASGASFEEALARAAVKAVT